MSGPFHGFRPRPGRPHMHCYALLHSLLHCLGALPTTQDGQPLIQQLTSLLIFDTTRIAETKKRHWKCAFIRRRLNIRSDMLADAEGTAAERAPGRGRTNRKSGGTAAKRFAVCSDRCWFPTTTEIGSQHSVAKLVDSSWSPRRGRPLSSVVSDSGQARQCSRLPNQVKQPKPRKSTYISSVRPTCVPAVALPARPLIFGSRPRQLHA